MNIGKARINFIFTSFWKTQQLRVERGGDEGREVGGAETSDSVPARHCGPAVAREPTAVRGAGDDVVHGAGGGGVEPRVGESQLLLAWATQY